MLLIFLIWVFTFLLICSIGYSILSIINKDDLTACKETKFDESFFAGFVAITLFTSFYSIFLPIDFTALGVVLLIAFMLSYYNSTLISRNLVNLYYSFMGLGYKEKFVIIFIVGFAIASVTKFIQVFDTGLYHTQNIKWITSYPVIPGLGNLHGRFAFNSLFFPISGLFTVDTLGLPQYAEILIYPLNGVAFMVLFVRFLLNIRLKVKTGLWVEAIGIALVLVLCLYYFAEIISSPSPDVIIAIIVLYTFYLYIEPKGNLSKTQFYLIVGMVLTAITIKLSTLFLSLLLVPVLIKKFNKARAIIIISTGLIVFTPYLIRNYYLSGYLVYPFPQIDVYNVDWKIPFRKAINEKNAIESWAKKPGAGHGEVLKWEFTQWLKPWFLRQLGFMKILLILNLAAVLSMIIYYRLKMWTQLFTHSIIIINLLFWLFSAPAPRFVYGFLFLGASLTLSSFLLFTRINLVNKKLLLAFSFGIILIVPFVIKDDLVERFISRPVNWVYPEMYPESIQDKKLQWWKNGSLNYNTPLNGQRCFNAPLPCLPLKNENLILRTGDIEDGFRVKD